MHYYGAVYRPPSEAYSLIVQCTLGCSHNKCAFCNMYKDKKFSIRPVEEVLRDLAEARSYERRIERIFLADGDALILPMDYLLQVLDFIREYFPSVRALPPMPPPRPSNAKRTRSCASCVSTGWRSSTSVWKAAMRNCS